MLRDKHSSLIKVTFSSVTKERAKSTFVFYKRVLEDTEKNILRLSLIYKDEFYLLDVWTSVSLYRWFPAEGRVATNRGPESLRSSTGLGSLEHEVSPLFWCTRFFWLLAVIRNGSWAPIPPIPPTSHRLRSCSRKPSFLWLLLLEVPPPARPLPEISLRPRYFSPSGH